MRWNRLKSAKSLRAGQSLIVGYRRVPADSTVQRNYRWIKVPRHATLSHLAMRYKTSVRQLMRWNGLKKATDLRAGMKLIVSKPSNLRDSDHKVIRVRSGDTLSKIAMRYRTSVKTLVALNDLKSKNLLRLNQRLLVPTLTTNES